MSSLTPGKSKVTLIDLLRSCSRHEIPATLRRIHQGCPTPQHWKAAQEQIWDFLQLPPPLPSTAKPITLHQTQIDFHKSRALYRGFVSGRSGGKSFAGAYDMCRRAKPGHTYLVASPTGVKGGDETFPTFKAIAQDLDLWGTVKMTPWPTATLKNGATVRFRSAEDPEKLRGPNLSGVWLDEGSLMEEKAFTICIACLREKGEQGWLTCTFTPNGTGHWTYEQFAKANSDTELFHCHTRDNPFNPPGFADTLARKYVGAWALQELGGLFVAMEGAEFAPEWFGDDIWFDRWPDKGDVLLRVIALDPSKGKDARVRHGQTLGDYSAFVIIHMDKHGVMWVDADMDQRRDVTRIVKDGIRLYTQHVPDAFAVEINQFQELLAKDFIREAHEHKPRLILPVYGWDNTVNKEVRIRRLAPTLAGIDGRMRFKNSPGGQILVAQLRDFRPKPQPSGYHDDGGDALEMAMRMLMHLMGQNEHGAPQVVRIGARPEFAA